MIQKTLLLLSLMLFLLISACKKKDEPVIEPDNTIQSEIDFKLKLKNTSSNIDYDQSFNDTDDLEYEWGIYIDSDSDSLTGDTEGYDVAVSMSYFKQSASTSSGSIISKTQKNTWKMSTFSAQYGHSLTAEIDAPNNILILKGSKTWLELSAVNAGDKVKVITRYSSSTGQISDESTVVAYPGIISDSTDDVSSDFIDIISLEIVEL